MFKAAGGYHSSADSGLPVTVLATLDAQGFFPLNYAYLHGTPWLLRSVAGAYPRAILEENGNGERILDMAIQKGEKIIIQNLLHLGGEWILGSSVSEFFRMPVLHRFASASNMQLVEMLLELGADVNILDGSKRTPIFTAIESLSLELVQMLVRNGALLDIVDGEGNFPLLTAAGIIGAAPIIAYLISQNNSQLLMVNHCGRGLLHESATIGSNLSIFLEEYPHGYMHSFRSETPLHLAARKGTDDTVRMILKAGANIEAIDRSGSTALQIGLWSLEISRVLLEWGANIYVKKKQGLELVLGVLCCSIDENVRLFDLFLDRYWSDRRSFRSQSPNLDHRLWEIALGKAETKTLRYLLQRRENPLDRQAVLRFVANGRIPVPLEKLELIREYGVILSETRPQDCSILHARIKKCQRLELRLEEGSLLENESLFRALLQCGLAANSICPADDVTPLQMAMGETFVCGVLGKRTLCRIACSLLEHGVDPNQRICLNVCTEYRKTEYPAQSLLCRALELDDEALVHNVLIYGATIEYAESVDKDKFVRTLMSRHRTLRVWELLLDRGLDPNGTFIPLCPMKIERGEDYHDMVGDKNRISFLFYFAFWGDEQMICLLLKHGASPEWADHFGRTALHFYFYGRKQKGGIREQEIPGRIVSRLLTQKVDPCRVDSFLGMAPIHLAAEWCSSIENLSAIQKMMDWIRSRDDIDIDIHNGDGLRAIDMAACGTRSICFRIIQLERVLRARAEFRKQPQYSFDYLEFKKCTR